MKRLVSALVLFTACGLALSGCGDDDDDGGMDNTAGETGAAGAPSLNLACTPSEETTCQNETDCSYVLDGTARTTAQTCGKGCIGGDENCARDCIVDELPMTSDCAGCYADFVNCTIANCVGACLTDPDSDGCHTCQEEEGCRPGFNTCSGLPE
jgi:hypothetical protein